MHHQSLVPAEKQPNVIEDRQKKILKMEELKLYLVEFNEDSIIKEKTYPANCIVNSSDCQPVIVNTYDVFIFFTNNRIRKA